MDNEMVGGEVNWGKRNWSWLHEPKMKSERHRYVITQSMHLLWLFRQDLWPFFDLTTEEGRQGFYSWWIADGRQQYPGVSWNSGTEEEAFLAEPAPGIEQDLPLPLTRGLVAIWATRPDLQERYPLGMREGRLSFLAWWLGGGYGDHGLELVGRERLCEVADGIEQDLPLPLTRGLVAIWATRPDLQERYPLGTREGRLSFLAWWLGGGHGDHGLELVGKERLCEVADGIEQDLPLPLTRGLVAIWEIRDDLQRAYPLKSRESRLAYLRWWLEGGFHEYSFDVLGHQGFQALNLLRNGYQLTDRSSHLEKRAEHQRPPDSKDANSIEKMRQLQSPFVSSPCNSGVNIVGFAKAEIGIGEDVRMAVEALSAVRVPFSVYDAPIEQRARALDTRADRFLSRQAPYGFNLIFLPAVETFRILLESGPRVFENRFSIGAWQWELPNWPEELQPIYNLVEEIWSPSRYTAETFSKSAPVPVSHMPMAVRVEKTPTFSRSEFGLPEARFLYLIMFDGNSWLRRKNPVGAAEAFMLAFPRSNRDVGLVVKAMNVRTEHPEWRRLLELIKGDDRVVVFNETFERDRALGLLACCDAYVSLHRAEGFGRVIAEAMLLGKPVIVTNYSGNTDFTTSETAVLVNGPLVPLKPGDYSFFDGGYWCEPNLDSAVEAMRLCLFDRERVHKLAKAGQEYIRHHYNPQVVGNRYRKRLEQLGLLI